MQLELEDTRRQLADACEAHATLQAAHDQVSAHFSELRRQCVQVRGLLHGAPPLVCRLLLCAWCPSRQAWPGM